MGRIESSEFGIAFIKGDNELLRSFLEAVQPAFFIPDKSLEFVPVFADFADYKLEDRFRDALRTGRGEFPFPEIPGRGEGRSRGDDNVVLRFQCFLIIGEKSVIVDNEVRFFHMVGSEGAGAVCYGNKRLPCLDIGSSEFIFKPGCDFGQEGRTSDKEHIGNAAFIQFGRGKEVSYGVFYNPVKSVLRKPFNEFFPADIQWFIKGSVPGENSILEILVFPGRQQEKSFPLPYLSLTGITSRIHLYRSLPGWLRSLYRPPFSG